MKKIPILVLCYLLGSLPAFAQWSVGDSLALSRVLSGKDTIRLNPETMESIRKGTFLNLDKPLTAPMESMSLEMPLVKDFSEYFEMQDTIRPLKLFDLPPHIVLRYYNPKKPDRMLEFSDEYFYFYLKNSTRGMSGGQSHDFAHILNTAFSPEYRRLMKNRKNATKLQFYGELPKAELQQKQQQFLSAHPELRKPANAAEAEKMKNELAEKGNEVKMGPPTTSQSSFGPDSVFVVFPVDSFEYKTQPN